MPPRFAYWTILIDSAPTAFRARDPLELLPTLNQLKRTNPNAIMKWFSGGRLWDSPDAAREARRRPKVATEKRGTDWRPGGTHRDPRDRFKKKKHPQRGGRPWGGKPPGGGVPRGDRPWRPKPAGSRPIGGRPWQAKGRRDQRSDKPWQNRPRDENRKPFVRRDKPFRRKRRDDEPER